jgi:hypothetical protein
MRALITMWLLVSGASLAVANPAMEGQWMLEVRPGGAPVVGLLEVERDGRAWRGFVEGGPAPVEVDGDRIMVDIDSRDLRGFIFILKLEGTLDGDTLSGDYTVESDADVPFTAGSWSAERYVPEPRSETPEPVDISGIWKPAPGVDFRKYSMTLTPKAQAWHDGYLMHYDQPNVRCISPGIVAMVAWGGYPFEVLESEQRLTFLYEVDSEVRRIYLDGREPPPYYPGSGMGFSTGRWEGSALVIQTTNLAPNVRDFRGEPISENARMEEVYTLSEDGQRLNGVITLHDPENYERPPIRRRAWVRDANTDIYPYECDPDSFYRQMYNEGRLDMYFERSKRRM